MTGTDPCDDIGRNGWRAWVGLRQCGHAQGPVPCPGCVAELREGIPSGAGMGSLLGHDVIPGYAGPVDGKPGADDQPLPSLAESDADRRDWRTGRELPADLKIGDRVPMPPRKLDVRPSFVDKLDHPRGVFNRGRKQTI